MLRPQISINNKYIASSISNNVKFIFFALVLIIYFAWMDIALFMHVQHWTIPPMRKENTILVNKLLNKSIDSSSYDYPLKNYKNNRPQEESSVNENQVLGTFTPLSIKLIMLDHGTHYIHDIVARFIENTFQFTSNFPWVTPDLVSFGGLVISFISCKFILSEKRSHNRIGAVLFELRNLADAMDGVVYRSRKHITVFLRSNPSNHGFQVDAICDSIAGFAIVLTIFVKILRHPPHKDRTPKLITIKYKAKHAAHKEEHEALSGDSTTLKYQLIQAENFLDVTDKSNDNISDSISLGNESPANSEYFASAAAANISFSQSASPNSKSRTMSAKLIFAYVFFFGIRLLFSSAMWNYFMQNYQDLLMNFSQNVIQRVKFNFSNY